MFEGDIMKKYLSKLELSQVNERLLSLSCVLFKTAYITKYIEIKELHVPGFVLNVMITTTKSPIYSFDDNFGCTIFFAPNLENESPRCYFHFRFVFSLSRIPATFAQAKHEVVSNGS